jgi:hypothetical protein
MSIEGTVSVEGRRRRMSITVGPSISGRAVSAKIRQHEARALDGIDAGVGQHHAVAGQSEGDGDGLHDIRLVGHDKN